MKLSEIYRELRRNAARTGQDRAADLRGGARVAVRVRVGTTTVTFSRRAVRLGDTELITFRQACGVPQLAERLPQAGQRTSEHAGATWYSVSYRWHDQVPVYAAGQLAPIAHSGDTASGDRQATEAVDVGQPCLFYQQYGWPAQGRSELA